VLVLPPITTIARLTARKSSVHVVWWVMWLDRNPAHFAYAQHMASFISIEMGSTGSVGCSCRCLWKASWMLMPY